jgi:hypothetical protein
VRIASACGSTSWVASVVGIHPWHITMFDHRAQSDVWSGNPNTMASTSYPPTDHARRVPAGFRLSGKWSYSNGVDHCDWVILGAVVPDNEPDGFGPEFRSFLVPRGDVTVDQESLALTWRDLHARVTRGEEIPYVLRTRFRYDAAHALAHCAGGVYRLLEVNGGRTMNASEAFQRLFRDLLAMRNRIAHVGDQCLGVCVGETRCGTAAIRPIAAGVDLTARRTRYGRDTRNDTDTTRTGETRRGLARLVRAFCLAHLEFRGDAHVVQNRAQRPHSARQRHALLHDL